MKTETALALGLIIAAAGCGSSGVTASDGGRGGTAGGGGAGGSGADGSGAGACVAFSPAGAKMSWLDNGTPQCAYLILATRMTSSSQDFLEIIASTNEGNGAGITVASYSGPLGGTYHCTDAIVDGGLGPAYVNFTYPGTLVDCTITIENPGAVGGANATGSFSATLTAAAGGTTSVTSGSFDTPVMATGG
jgi:hypothetical protein